MYVSVLVLECKILVCLGVCMMQASLLVSVCVGVCMFWHESVCQCVCDFHEHAKHKLQANNQKVVVLGSKLRQKQVVSAILWSRHI